MSTTAVITSDERTIVRELARKYRGYAELAVMEERRKLWYAHNALRGERPVVVMETGPFLGELIPSLRCSSPLAKSIEWNLMTGIVNHELVDDDKVLSAEYVVPLKVGMREFDMSMHVERAADAQGRKLGYAVEHAITDLERDLPRMRHSIPRVDREGTEAERVAVEEAIGDILPVRVKNLSLMWYPAPSGKIVHLMGMELMLTEMAERPELMKALYQFVADDILMYLDWQEGEGLLTLNNGNDYAGAGSYGFTNELPRNASGPVRTSDLWGNLNSQETVGVSPGMFAEICYPAYEQLARRFGLVYYGCCEPVHSIWDNCLSRLPNLRKVSVSAWCDERQIGEKLRGGKVIYSRKPRPNFIGVGEFDASAFAEHIGETLQAARGCGLEIIFRDIYTLNNDRTRAGRAVKVVREQIGKRWA